jgi:hypothetical protein
MLPLAYCFPGRAAPPWHTAPSQHAALRGILLPEHAAPCRHAAPPKHALPPAHDTAPPPPGNGALPEHDAMPPPPQVMLLSHGHAAKAKK